MFRNETGWIFFTDDAGKSWQIQNAYKFPNYIIKEENTIPQAGIYTDTNNQIKLTADFDIEFNFDNFRDFIGIDTDNLQLTSNLNKIRAFDKDGIEIQNTDDVELDIAFICIYADQVTENNFSIPCESSASFTEFSRYGDLIFNSNLEIICDNENEILTVFVPTTPNPTSGFLLFVPKKDVIMLKMSVENAAKLVISAGLVVPDYNEKIN